MMKPCRVCHNLFEPTNSQIAASNFICKKCRQQRYRSKVQELASKIVAPPPKEDPPKAKIVFSPDDFIEPDPPKVIPTLEQARNANSVD